jgi:threonine dehydratase
LSPKPDLGVLPTLDDVRRAAVVLRGVARETPILTDGRLDQVAGSNVLVKAEFLQHGGSFKFRGIYNKLASLPPDEREWGIVIASSGNAGLAAALAARALRTSSVVVMPQHFSDVKRAAIEAAGGRVVAFGKTSDEMLHRAEEIADSERRAFVHPFDQPEVIAGQGTLALELDQNLHDFDAVVIPTGGGGLLSGVGLVLRALRPELQIIGVEPDGADSVRRSLHAGRVTAADSISTIAEGLAVQSCGKLTFEVIRRDIDEVITVSDAEILHAVGVFWNLLHVAVEPSGAAGLAALLAGERFEGKRVAVVATGANIDLRRLEEAARLP